MRAFRGSHEHDPKTETSYLKLTMIDVVNSGTELLYQGLAYLQENAWYIVILLVSGYYLKTNCK